MSHNSQTKLSNTLQVHSPGPGNVVVVVVFVAIRLSEGGSQTRPVIDAISIVTSAHKARRWHALSRSGFRVGPFFIRSTLGVRICVGWKGHSDQKSRDVL